MIDIGGMYPVSIRATVEGYVQVRGTTFDYSDLLMSPRSALVFGRKNKTLYRGQNPAQLQRDTDSVSNGFTSFSRYNFVRRTIRINFDFREDPGVGLFASLGDVAELNSISSATPPSEIYMDYSVPEPVWLLSSVDVTTLNSEELNALYRLTSNVSNVKSRRLRALFSTIAWRVREEQARRKSEEEERERRAKQAREEAPRQ